MADTKVRAVLINIFGGITRCDEVARGIIIALDEVRPEVPLVVRLVGMNAMEGRRMLDGARLISADTLVEAAEKVVGLVKGA